MGFESEGRGFSESVFLHVFTFSIKLTINLVFPIQMLLDATGCLTDGQAASGIDKAIFSGLGGKQWKSVTSFQKQLFPDSSNN